MVNFGLLVLLAALVVALLAGLPVPRLVIALVIGVQAVVRAFRELQFGTDASRRRLPFNLLISLVFVYLIMTGAANRN
jgi:hypothetical protein